MLAEGSSNKMSLRSRINEEQTPLFFLFVHSGTVGYDGGLLTVFRRYDDDHSGSISANEMIMMVSANPISGGSRSTSKHRSMLNNRL